jgi:hypothetical protein
LEPLQNGIELASCGCARLFVCSAPKKQQTCLGCAGAVFPTEAQQRLCHRELARLLELFSLPMKSFNNNISSMPSK